PSARFRFQLEFERAGAAVGDVGSESGLELVGVSRRKELFEVASIHGAGIGIGDEVAAVGSDELADDDAVGAGHSAFAFAIGSEELKFAAFIGVGHGGLAAGVVFGDEHDVGIAERLAVERDSAAGGDELGAGWAGGAAGQSCKRRQANERQLTAT